MGRINDGELSDEDEEALGEAIAEMVDDFGPDFDAEGQPLEEGESDRVKSEDERERPAAPTRRPRRRPRPSRARPRRSAEDGADERETRGSSAPSPWPPRRKSRTGSRRVKNIHKITRAMEMVAAARLRRAEQRIDAMRPYAQAIRKMTQQVAEAAAATIPRIALLEERESVEPGRDHPGHRRPRPRRRLQHQHHPRGRAAEARVRRRRRRGLLLGGRPARHLDA